MPDRMLGMERPQRFTPSPERLGPFRLRSLKNHGGKGVERFGEASPARRKLKEAAQLRRPYLNVMGAPLRRRSRN
jgi:hypothetical protein